MIKKLLLPALILFFMLVVAACASPTPLQVVTDTPTALPPTDTPVPPTNTPLPPTPTETATLAPTTTISATLTIQHFPGGQEFTVTTIDMIDANTGWAIGGLVANSDHVLRTSDGATTWTDVTPPEASAPEGERKIALGYFQDAQTAWVTFSTTSGKTPENPVVWRTQDGGESWSYSQPLDTTDLTENYYPSNLQFVGGTTGWLFVHVGVGMNHDYYVLYRSSDAGNSWERIIDPYNDSTGTMSCSKTGMLFIDATNGWLTGDCHGVAAGVLLFRTSDGGSTWQKIVLPEPADAPGLFTDMNYACGSYDPFFIVTDLAGHIGVRCTDYTQDPATNKYYVFTTPDGGNSWTSTTYPGVGLYFMNYNTGWSLDSTIQVTQDGGQTWKPIAQVDWSLTADFINATDGWGVARTGDQVALVKTTDGGAKWGMLIPKIGG